MKTKIVIGSRGSDLALWQANHVKKELEKKNKSVSTFRKKWGPDIENNTLLNSWLRVLFLHGDRIIPSKGPNKMQLKKPG